MYVFPTPVGVFLHVPGRAVRSRSLPHARGGVSRWSSLAAIWTWSSPRPWGCFWNCPANFWRSAVFPTPVGVFLESKRLSFSFTGLPHARGGVSWMRTPIHDRLQSSPRPWGCFFVRIDAINFCNVFPTPVGVFLRRGGQRRGYLRLPHARGGVSNTRQNAIIRRQYAP